MWFTIKYQSFVFFTWSKAMTCLYFRNAVLLCGVSSAIWIQKLRIAYCGNTTYLKVETYFDGIFVMNRLLYLHVWAPTKRYYLRYFIQFFFCDYIILLYRNLKNCKNVSFNAIFFQNINHIRFAVLLYFAFLWEICSL
jgi:hypothetical protein